MKRKIWKAAALLALAALLAAFAACGPDDFQSLTPAPEQPSRLQEDDTAHEAPLRVFVEPGELRNDMRANLENMLYWSEKSGGPGPEDVELEFLPGLSESGGYINSADREAALTHLRTEMMSGAGPDLLICSCDYLLNIDYLFRYPEQAMKRNLFLPLDGYIQNARFMQWDRLFPKVMEAGRTDQGQLVLPLTWRLPVTCFRKSEVEHIPSQTMTYGEALDSGDPVLTLGSAGTVLYGDEIPNIMQLGRMGCQFLQLADWDTETLAFSQEELLEMAENQQALLERWDAGEFDQAPQCFQNMLVQGYSEDSTLYRLGGELIDPFRGISREEALTMVPIYTREGGYGATITSFGAVNANSQRPEDAFFLLDLLLSKEYQASGVMDGLARRNSLGMPVHMDLGTEEDPFYQNWFFSEENYAAYTQLRDNIKEVRFGCRLDMYLEDVFVQVWTVAKDLSPEEEVDLPQAVEKLYTQMKMELGES